MPKMLEEFTRKSSKIVGAESGGRLTYLAPTHVNLLFGEEHWLDVKSPATRE